MAFLKPCLVTGVLSVRHGKTGTPSAARASAAVTSGDPPSSHRDVSWSVNALRIHLDQRLNRPRRKRAGGDSVGELQNGGVENPATLITPHHSVAVDLRFCREPHPLPAIRLVHGGAPKSVFDRSGLKASTRTESFGGSGRKGCGDLKLA